jgi:hypothetical protein
MVIDYVVCCRAHLATLELELPSYVILKEGSAWHDSSMIALLCALFLSKHGAGEAANAVEEKIAMEVRPCLSDWDP